MPHGVIQFQPDTSKGNTGPGAIATIKDGQFSTAGTGKGTIGGPHTVTISGYKTAPDPNAPFVDSEEGASNALFPDYQTTADLPQGPSEQTFEVPMTPP